MKIPTDWIKLEEIRDNIKQFRFPDQLLQIWAHPRIWFIEHE